MATSGIPDTSLPPPPGLPREERLDSIAALIRAQDDVIALARRHVKVFDIDLSWGGWNASARCAALGSYMRRIPGARLSIIVHDTRTGLDVRFSVTGSTSFTLDQTTEPAVLRQIYGAGPVAGTTPQRATDGLAHLTLITCAGTFRNSIGTHDHRLAVFATRIT